MNLFRFGRVLALLLLFPAVQLTVGCAPLSHLHVEDDFHGLGKPIGEARETHVFFVHGIKGYSESAGEGLGEDPRFIIERLVSQHGLRPGGTPVSAVVGLPSGSEGQIEGTLTTMAYQCGPMDAPRRVVFHVWKWVGITEAAKKLLNAQESAGPHGKWRLPLVARVKQGMVNEGMADVILYLGDTGDIIRRLTLLGLRKALDGAGPDAELYFVTFSMGAKVLLDTLMKPALVDNPLHERTRIGVLDECCRRVRGFYMLSNQLVLFGLADQIPDLAAGGEMGAEHAPGSVISKFCRYRVTAHAGGGQEPLQVVLFSDPNDLLSYWYPGGLNVEENARYINVYLSVADTVYCIPFIGGVTNVYAAHAGYGADSNVLKMLSDSLTKKKDWPQPDSP